MSWFYNLIHAINMIVWLGVTGFVIGVLCLFTGRIISGLQAYLIAGTLGAVLVLGTYWTGMIDTLASDSSKSKISSLENEKAKLESELALTNAVLDQERRAAEALAKANKANEATLEKLNSIIQFHEGDPYCGAFADELQAIGEIK